MYLIYNNSSVPQSILTVDPNLSVFANAGILHNIYLNYLNQTFQSIGYDADGPVVGYRCSLMAQNLEQQQLLPVGSANIISQALSSFLAVTDFNSGLKIWNDLYNQTLNNPNYNNTPLMAVISIANYSAQYWSYIMETWELVSSPNGNPPHPTPSASFLKIPKWLKTICVDIVGALGGVQGGAVIGSVVPGLGTAVGAAIGGVVGGAAASGAQ